MQRNLTLRGSALILATALHLAAGAAAAQQPAQPAAHSYVGVAVGRSNFDIDTTGATRSDTSSTGYKLFGGVQFTPNFGLEASAFSLGKATGAVTVPAVGTATVEGEVRGIALAGTASLPVSDSVALFAKAGLAYVETKATVSTPLGGASEDDKSTQPLFGLGARWNFSDTLAARLEWERVRARFVDSEKVNTDLISVGLQYRF
jgi:OOP family OmpA-OmpF porin